MDLSWTGDALAAAIARNWRRAEPAEVVEAEDEDELDDE